MSDISPVVSIAVSIKRLVFIIGIPVALLSLTSLVKLGNTDAMNTNSFAR